MIIAISVKEEKKDSKLDTRFGRASFFYFYDTEKTCGFFQNNQQNINAAHGAGIQAAQNVAKNNVDVLLTENVGPKAFRVLEGSRIKVYEASSHLTIDQALIEFEAGKLPLLIEANQ